MKAIRTHEPTGISGLVFEEAPDPRPMFCEVLPQRRPSLRSPPAPGSYVRP